MTERIELTLATAPDLRGVASLVLGGVGSRLDLAYERVDDLQIAVLSALEAVSEPAVEVEVDVADERVSVALGPLERELVADPALQRVLERLVDEVEELPRDGRSWLRLHIRRPPAAG